jgi:tetratricopeptide (TPR) repeat protein/tRNA A-37 threonylcarbamoyl transferase component Bud32
MSVPPSREVAIFNAALELEGSERAAYLDEACADDPALRQHLEALLRVHDEAVPFLETPPSGAQESARVAEVLGSTVPHSSSPAEQAGDRIGRYKLLQQIGEGGGGVVYMAEQEEPVRRRVALKVIKVGMDTKQVVARFEAERQALALMDHPNIARVLDAGATETGRPFFVMELVRGIKITDYCDQNNLPTEERLKLFTQVCQAIQHAHQKGVIHRDIKPSNILVTSNDGVPVPKVIDFGIAKATQGSLTDRTVFTAFEQFIGTPAYMSPEQAEMTMLDIDTRTDLYSLGVLLYELLTGRTPFDAKDLLAGGLDAMRRTIREREPVRPSTRLSTMIEGEQTTAAKHRQTDPPKLVHLLRGDLDWIVMKCLEKDRGRRYETATGLAMDVQHYLAYEPVVARPPSRAYRFQKLVRRNKGVFAAVGAVALMLLLGVAASTWQALRAGRAEREQGRLRLQAQAEADLLKKMLLSVGPSVAKGRNTEMLNELVADTARRVARDLTNMPEVQVDMSLTLADAYYDLGNSRQMVALARQSLQVARAKLGKENERVANSLTSLGVGLLSLAQQRLGEMFAGNVSEAEKNRRLNDSNLQEAEKCCLESLAMNRKLLGNEHDKVARGLHLLAQIRLTQYRMAEAESLQRESLAMYKKLRGNESASVAKVSQQLAHMLAFREDTLVEAEAMNREALAIQKKLLGEDHPEIARSLFSLASVLRRQGRWADAETNYLEGVTMWRRLRAKDGFEPASALGYLAEVLLHQGKLEDSEIQRRAEFEMLRRLYGTTNVSVVRSLSFLADVLQREGKLEEAEARAREALELCRSPSPAGSGSVVKRTEPIEALLSILLVQHREVEAEQLLNDCLKPTLDGQLQLLQVFLLRARSSFFARSRRWTEAIKDLRKVTELDRLDHEAAFQLTVLLLESGDRENCRAQCQKMAASFRGANAPGPLGKTAEACLLSAEAGADAESAGQLADQAFALGKNSYRVYHLQFVKGLAEYRAGHFASAVEWMGKSIGQPTMVFGPRPDGPAYLVQAMAQHQLKRSDEARVALTKGAEIVQAKLLNLPNAALDENWVDWLIAHILLREAQGLIEGQIDAPSHPPKTN